VAARRTPGLASATRRHSVALGGGAFPIVVAAAEPAPYTILLVAGATAVVTLVVLYGVVRWCLHVVGPNELLVISGGRHRLPDGSIVGYRIVRSGRALRIPLMETATTLSLNTLSVNVEITNAHTQGGAVAQIQMAAAVRLAGDLPLARNAVERFLGNPRDVVADVARQVLEGAARQVAAASSLDEIQYDRARFEATVLEEAEHEIGKLGMLIESLKLLRVSTNLETYRERRPG